MQRHIGILAASALPLPGIASAPAYAGEAAVLSAAFQGIKPTLSQ